MYSTYSAITYTSTITGSKETAHVCFLHDGNLAFEQTLDRPIRGPEDWRALGISDRDWEQKVGRARAGVTDDDWWDDGDGGGDDGDGGGGGGERYAGGGSGGSGSPDGGLPLAAERHTPTPNKGGKKSVK